MSKAVRIKVEVELSVSRGVVEGQLRPIWPCVLWQKTASDDKWLGMWRRGRFSDGCGAVVANGVGQFRVIRTAQHPGRELIGLHLDERLAEFTLVHSMAVIGEAAPIGSSTEELSCVEFADNAAKLPASKRFGAVGTPV